MRHLAACLTSPNWGERIAGQEVLETLTLSEDWSRLLSNVPATNYPVLKVLTGYLIRYVLGHTLTPTPELLPHLLGPHSPLAKHKDLTREVLESFLMAHKIGYRNKIDLLMVFLEHSKHQHFEEHTVIFLIRALGFLKTKRAITQLGNRIDSSEEVVHEIIRALRQIRDRKSGPTLERIFHSSNRILVSAAVAAYGELGGNEIWRAVRLYRLYSKARESVKLAILRASMKFEPFISSLLVRRFFWKESSELVRSHILTKMALIPSTSSTELLLRLASSEGNPNLRTAAIRSLEAIPALTLTKTIKRSLRSKNRWIRNWALQRVADLPPDYALGLLRPFMLPDVSLEPMLTQSLLDTLGKIRSEAHDHVIESFLLAQLGKNTLCTTSVLHGLLAKTKPPVRLVLEQSEKDTDTLECALALLGDYFHKDCPLEILRIVEGYLDHPEYRIRYQAARLLLRQHRSELFLHVWARAQQERELQLRAMATLIANALSERGSLPQWISLEVTSGLLLKQVLTSVRTAHWRASDWVEILGLLSSKISFITSGLEDQLSEPEMILWDFINRHPHFWTDILNKLLLEETDPITMRLLASILRTNPKTVTTATLECLFKRLQEGLYPDPTGALTILLLARPQHLLIRFVEWCDGSSSHLRTEAFQTLSLWLRENLSTQMEQRVG